MIAEFSDHAIDHIGLAAFGIVLALAVAACVIYLIKREYDSRRPH